MTDFEGGMEHLTGDPDSGVVFFESGVVAPDIGSRAVSGAFEVPEEFGPHPAQEGFHSE